MQLEAMERAAQEIRSLRARNGRLQGIADTVAAFSAALLGPPREGGMAPDPLWELERAIAEKRADLAPDSDKDA